MWPERAGEGWVVHRRITPRVHQFRHRVLYTLVDVAEGDERRTIVAQLTERGLQAPQQLMRLAQRRALGARFNPVVFYFSISAGRVDAVVAEINNTPWDERHRYVLDARVAGQDGRFRFAKTFHVSPFNPMDLVYDWRFDVDTQRVRIDMRLERDGEQVMYAGLDLHMVPLTRAVRWRGAMRYPAQGWVTLARIYWHALRLWLKRVPFYPHPDSPREGANVA